MIEVYCTDKDGNLVERLTQWDVDQYILIGGSGLIEAPKIHFCNAVSDEALVVGSEMEGDLIKAKIPNILLQDKYLIMAYLYVYDPTVSSISAMTKATIKIPILPRQKPSNYPYVEDIDYISATSLEAKIEKEIEDLNGELSESYNQTLSRIETSLEDEYKSTTNAIREEYDVYFNQMKDEHSSMVSDYEGIKVDYNLLSSDLRETDSQLKELSANIRSDMNDLEESYSETTTNLENRYSETIDDLVSKFSDGSPKGYFSNVEGLSGKVAGVYINDADGYVYYWDGETISDAITRYEYTVDTDALNNHIANKNEPHVQRVSVGAMTTLSDIIDGTYTGFDGDEFITSDDIKKFYLTDVGGTHDGVELIVAGSYIDGGCIQVLNVYVSGNVEVSPQICKQYYRTKQMGSWTEWKLAEDFDEELSVTSTNAVQNKVVTAEIDNIKANINALPKTGAESGTIATCIKENKTETVAIDANNPYYVYPEEGYGQYVIEFENTPTVTYPVIVSYTKGGSSFLYKDSPFYVSDTKVVIPIPFEGDDVRSIKISDNTANTVTVTATSSIFAEVKDGSIGAAKLDTELAERISNIETDLANALDGLITYGTEELTDGVSELPTGTLYIVYE